MLLSPKSTEASDGEEPYKLQADTHLFLLLIERIQSSINRINIHYTLSYTYYLSFYFITLFRCCFLVFHIIILSFLFLSTFNFFVCFLVVCDVLQNSLQPECDGDHGHTISFCFFLELHVVVPCLLFLFLEFATGFLIWHFLSLEHKGKSTRIRNAY
jgi:hypothetical protein